PALLGRVAIRKSREHNLPLVYTYHTRYADYAHYAEPLPQPKIKEFITLWLRDFMTECHHVVVPSQSIKDMLLEQYPTIRNVSIVPTGVDTRRFSGFEKSAVRKELGWTDEKVVISVGRLAREKSFHVLIKAFARLDLADTRLVIIGEGDERENLEELIQESGCADRVTLTGLVPFHQVPKYLAAADLFSFASITETQGLVTMEAMAAGLPVVAVEASGTREAVDSSCAVLTQYEPEALARGLQEMLSRDNLAKASEASRQRALEFDIMKQGEAMVEVYEQARESHRAGQYVLSERKELRDRLEEIFEILKP
ncbi:MAG TPA: glycosyltransferase, partial [Phycisphaerales bacterium]|nr:glycosyltransferase [Phycisphaerales bacterium]